MSRVLPVIIGLLFVAPAFAITGNAPPATGWAARALVMVVDEHGNLCTGTALTRELVLTAAHCVVRPFDYQVKTFQSGRRIPVQGIARHPDFHLDNYLAARVTTDLALLKVDTPIDDIIQPATLAPARRVAAGETLTIAGFGVTIAGTASGLGVPRMAKLTVTGKPGSLQIRMVDPAAQNKRIGLGACVGDSGAPVYDGERVIGVVSWSTAPNDEEGCGGLTGVTPLLLHHKWIADTARKFNSPIEP
jgi:hypothetical protein